MSVCVPFVCYINYERLAKSKRYKLKMSLKNPLPLIDMVTVLNF